VGIQKPRHVLAEAAAASSTPGSTADVPLPPLLLEASPHSLPAPPVRPFAALLPVQDLTAANPCKGQKDGTVLPSAGCSPMFYQCWKGKPVSPNQRCANTPQGQTVFNPKTQPAGCSL